MYIGQQQRSSNFTRLFIKKKKLNYYQGHSRSNDKNKNKKTLTTQSFEINVAKDPTASD
jgi:hypothetical protein